MPNLNDKFIKSLPLPQSKDKIYYDDRLTGLGVRITNIGSKSFFLRYVINGRERKYKIGGYPELSCVAAKEIAIQLKSEIARGFDPHEEKQAIVNTPTIKEFTLDFLKAKEKVLRPSTLKSYRLHFLERHIIPKFGNLKINAINKKEIEMFHSSFSETPRMGNRLLELLRVMFNMAVSWDVIEKNPTQGIKKFPEHKRERYLSQEEIDRLMKALDSDPNQTNANIVRLILLTGSRKGEVLSARWQDFDFENGVWIKPVELTKQKKSSHIPLNQEALSILKSMKRKNDFLFFNEKSRDHLHDIKKFWKRICEEAQIKNATIHDLRHTFASTLVSDGVSLEIIGKLIGHSNIRTTQRYSHLANSALRQATDMFSSKIMKKI